MEEIKIVEYQPALAEKVADMWNKSSEGWNGAIVFRTADSIILEHNNAHHLKVYICKN